MRHLLERRFVLGEPALLLLHERVRHCAYANMSDASSPPSSFVRTRTSSA
jgi:hypothetical protein